VYIAFISQAPLYCNSDRNINIVLAAAMAAINASAAFPAQFHATIASVDTAGILSKISESATPTNLFGVFLTLFLAAIVYDQCKDGSSETGSRNTG
jgi:hypothetical protein